MLDPEIRGQPKDVVILDGARSPATPPLAGRFFAFAYHQEYKLHYVGVSTKETVLDDTSWADRAMSALGCYREMENTYGYKPASKADVRQRLVAAGATESKILRDFLKDRG